MALIPFGDDDSWARQQLEVAGPLQNTAKKLGSEMLAAATAFKSQGKELPGELLARYVQWEEEFSILRQAWDTEPRFEQYRPSEKDQHSVAAWIVGLNKCIQDIEEWRARVAAERDEKLRVIDSVLSLTCPTGNAAGLKDVQIVADSLRLQLLDSPETWEGVLKAPEHDHLRVFWDLVQDARDGRIDEPESVERSEAVAKQFGIRTAQQAYAGRFVSPN